MGTQLQPLPIKQWAGVEDRPVVISGPCSAESEEQVLATARELARIGKIDLLRAGIWKPRTRPNSFEGVGEKGLQWLVTAREETGIPVTTEVANASHAEKALEAGIDVLWIGARTTVSPFAVQEIADVLRGTEVPVMVKNPINPDLKLWIGALERLSQAGITKLAAIHRGFSTYRDTPFRNEPKWEYPIELKRQVPEIGVICDPSHIAGNRDLLPFISQKALDLDMQGLMIESHIHPEKALSDADQQVTPSELGRLLKDLTIRTPTTEDEAFRDHLDELREKIDRIDDALLEHLASRMEIVEEIGRYKRDNDVTILQVNRWASIVEKRLSMGKAMGLEKDMLKSILELLHQYSIQRQNRIMNETSEEAKSE